MAKSKGRGKQEKRPLPPPYGPDQLEDERWQLGSEGKLYNLRRPLEDQDGGWCDGGPSTAPLPDEILLEKKEPRRHHPHTTLTGGSDGPSLVTLQTSFLEALSECGDVVDAARVAGCSPRRARRWERDDPTFSEMMAQAREVGLKVRLDRLENEMDRRAIDGVDKPVYQGGKLVGTRREFSDLLAIFRAKKLDPGYRDQQPRVGDSRPINIQINLPGVDALPPHLEQHRLPGSPGTLIIPGPPSLPEADHD